MIDSRNVMRACLGTDIPNSGTPIGCAAYPWVFVSRKRCSARHWLFFRIGGLLIEMVVIQNPKRLTLQYSMCNSCYSQYTTSLHGSSDAVFLSSWDLTFVDITSEDRSNSRRVSLKLIYGNVHLRAYKVLYYATWIFRLSACSMYSELTGGSSGNRSAASRSSRVHPSSYSLTMRHCFKYFFCYQENVNP